MSRRHTGPEVPFLISYSGVTHKFTQRTNLSASDRDKPSHNSMLGHPSEAMERGRMYAYA